jgi:hypothetical protein
MTITRHIPSARKSKASKAPAAKKPKFEPVHGSKSGKFRVFIHTAEPVESKEHFLVYPPEGDALYTEPQAREVLRRFHERPLVLKRGIPFASDGKTRFTLADKAAK